MVAVFENKRLPLWFQFFNNPNPRFICSWFKLCFSISLKVTTLFMVFILRWYFVGFIFPLCNFDFLVVFVHQVLNKNLFF